MQNNLIYVPTPHGQKLHGYLKPMVIGKKTDGSEENIIGSVFCREVNYNKDRMRIFDAWSINPHALDRLEKRGVFGLQYTDEANKKRYSLRLAELLEMIEGTRKDEQGRVQAWRAEFEGGKTIYIKLSAFRVSEVAPSKT